MFLTKKLYEVGSLIIYVIIWTSCKEALSVVLKKGNPRMHCVKLRKSVNTSQYLKCKTVFLLCAITFMCMKEREPKKNPAPTSQLPLNIDGCIFKLFLFTFANTFLSGCSNVCFDCLYLFHRMTAVTAEHMWPWLRAQAAAVSSTHA